MAIDLTDAAQWLMAWNDEHRVPTDIRILKLQEEAGEAAQAYLGWLGANPRKGITHDLEELHAELADVALAALVALASLRAEPMAVLRSRAQFVVERLGGEIHALQCCGGVVGHAWRCPLHAERRNVAAEYDVTDIAVPPEPLGVTAVESVGIDVDDFGTKARFGKTYSGDWKANDGFGTYYAWEDLVRRFGPIRAVSATEVTP